MCPAKVGDIEETDSRKFYFHALLIAALTSEFVFLVSYVIQRRLDLIPWMVLPYLVPTLITLSFSRKHSVDRTAPPFLFIVFTATGLLRLLCEPNYMVDFVMLPIYITAAYFILLPRAATFLSVYLFCLLIVASLTVHFFRPFDIRFTNDGLGMSLWVAAASTFGILIFSHLYYRRRITQTLQASLLTARKLADTNEDYRMLLSVVIHDLRNDLSSVQTAFEHLEKSEPRESPKYIGIGKKGATQLVSLANNLKHLRTVAGTEQESMGDRISLFTLLESVRFVFAQKLLFKRMKLEIRNAMVGSDDDVRVEPVTFRTHVLGNLVDNGIKYAAPGSTILVVVEDQNGSISIRISNPISASASPSMAGLGLEIVKRFCAEMRVEFEHSIRTATDGLWFETRVKIPRY